MSLFQKSVLNKYIKQLEKPKVDKAYKKYANHFLNLTIQENIRNSKEEEYQGIFLTDLFVNILDFTLKPNPNFNLVAEYKNQTNSRKADGAILIDDKAVGVIELKGTNTKDLESIRKQAFDYKANQKECVYVVSSNYEKLRFYINDATEFEEFNLFELTREQFDLLYLCLHKDNIVNNIPLKIKQDSLLEEEKITKKFYQDYSVFKRELYRDLVKRNTKRIKNTLGKLTNETNEADLDEETKAEIIKLEKNVKLNLFKKSQKLIDRFLFVFFAEDRGLLPPNSTLQILNKWKADIDFGDERPLYDMFKQYFKFLDIGRQGTTNRAEIYAYNGGLFKEDIVLDQLEIDNDLLYNHTKILAAYDFESQVDVNILGHIFENSLNEIESVNSEIEGGDFDKQTSKRKKDGVFYTPKYITKYIVENTIGKLCTEKKNELGFKEEEYFKGRKNRLQTTIIKLVEILDNYRDWLLQLTICDPACGSGAFLNQALDFLIKEHNYIDELKAKILGGGIVFSDIENTILEKNIYGVDLNEESVEIAKLSLWLRTAQPRRKLNNLNSNIKCGNSLIESKTFAGDKAFNWKEQFPKVFDKGGFDVIIGNPPYVQHRNLIAFSTYFKRHYEVYTGTSDLSVYFYERGIGILKADGYFGFINTNKFFNTEYGKPLRDYLSKYQIDQIVNFEQVCIFKGALVSSTINIIKKTISDKEVDYIEFSEETIDSNTFDNEIIKRIRKINKEYLINKSWIFEDTRVGNLINKIKKSGDYFNSLKGVKINRGITTGFDDAYIIDEDEYKKILRNDPSTDTIIKPLLKGKNINRYFIENSGLWLLNIHNGLGDEVPRINLEENFKYLFERFYNLNNERGGKIESRTDKGKHWTNLRSCAFLKEFEKPKVVWGLISGNWSFSIDNEKNFLTSASYFLTSEFIPIEVFNVLMNSKLFKFYFENVGEKTAGGAYVLKKVSVEKFILPRGIESQIINIKYYSNDIALKVSSFNSLNSKFTKYLQSQFAIEKFTKKLENWYELSFGDFIKEVNKAIKETNKDRVKNNLQPIKELTKLDEMDWMEVFETKKEEAQNLKQQIRTTDKEIDAMVYELYGLTDEEILIVENS
ncbi:Eco57I restriction-modification methylase domain-containing protein [Flavobacterium sasangense]|uniref:Eco57I restriction-modification methylase domain-containing protein n=1 Tax=Flavobacterium sasangense TaxID=503361 RepID=UPI00047CA89F|nr:N-6 DNA methylase [Flavobacterium sasangense]